MKIKPRTEPKYITYNELSVGDVFKWEGQSTESTIFCQKVWLYHRGEPAYCHLESGNVYKFHLNSTYTEQHRVRKINGTFIED
jgi:hypothetical protein